MMKELLFLESLTVVDLSWNNIHADGASLIIDGLSFSKIKSLDLSWNKIGQKADVGLGFKLAEACNLNKELRHLDISHNKIRLDVMSVFGEGIKDNHTLYGIHVLSLIHI